MDVMIDYQRKDKDATKLPLLLLSSFAAKMPMQTSVCQTVGVRARMCHFSRFGERACWRKGHGGGGLRACAPAFAGELCCQCVNREEKTTWWWFACVHACVVAGEECVWARTRLKRASQTGCAWSHQTLKSWAMTTSTADAHAHTRTHTCTLSFFPFLHTYLGQVVQVSFSASFVLCLPNTRVDTLSFFFLLHSIVKKILYGGKKNFLQNECWLETGCTDGGICVC